LSIANPQSRGLVLDAYIRVSRVGRRRGASFISPKIQRQEIFRWAERNGASIAEIFEELDRSGRRADRPLLLAAVGRIEEGASAGLVVATADRFFRSSLDGQSTLKRVLDAGGHFFTARESFDLGSDAGRWMLRNLLSTAEFYSDRLGTAWAQAKDEAINRGVYPASHVPFGYRRTRAGRLRPNPATAPHVIELFRLRAAGESMASLCRYMEEQGIRTSSGHAGWSRGALTHLLHNRAYLGEIHWGATVRPAAHPPLVDAVIWEAAQRPTLLGRQPSHRRSLLTGLVRCAGCCMSMSPTTRGVSGHKSYRVYYCHGHSAGGPCPARAGARAELLETHVEQAMLDCLRRRRGRPLGALAAAEAAAADADAALARYRDSDRILKTLGPSAYTAGFAARANRLRAARLKVADLRASDALHELPSADQVAADWPTMPIERRRQLLGQVLDCVFVSAGRDSLQDRVTVCPAGTAPANLPQIGDKRTRARPFRPRGGPRNTRLGTRAADRWSNARLERELREFLADRSHWPPDVTFIDAGRSDLLHQALLRASRDWWAFHLRLPVEEPPGSPRPWTDERIRRELDHYLHGKTRWPTRSEFKADGRRPLSIAIERAGGIARWSAQYPEVGCPQAFRWTDELIRDHLATLCRDRTTLPSQREFAKAGLHGLNKALSVYHGRAWWAEELGLAYDAKQGHAT
jgi:DNA invertase Pin-like site-specific DNA recombinase